MRSNKIKGAALKYFTLHGYEGASLSQIAEEAGIKKQSIYAHFKSKDDLFLQLLQDAKEVELSSKLQYFNEKAVNHPEKDLYGFLIMVTQLFQKDEYMKFWLRMSFFPPDHLLKEIEKNIIDIEQQVKESLEKKFSEWIEAKVIYGTDPQIPTIAYIGIIDAIMVELVYTNSLKKVEDRLEASWKVFWRGISLER
ncbi:TetR/AcrR family transcriptional regulator [Pseudobacillus sp. 179-B 2D1 NHS]|uniref:TetR/AcrR family transcriptional regulator n=1 Tax=Pseudobacillus sp. 179-B 2D1 NHS TaxID=3374292 RepID=UPI00387A3491